MTETPLRGIARSSPISRFLSGENLLDDYFQGANVDSQVVDSHRIYELDLVSTQVFELNAEDTVSARLLESNDEGTVSTQLFELDAGDTEITTFRARKLVDSKDKILLNVASEELRYFSELRTLAESQSSVLYY